MDLPLQRHRCKLFLGHLLLLSGGHSDAIDTYSEQYLGQLLYWLLVPAGWIDIYLEQYLGQRLYWLLAPVGWTEEMSKMIDCCYETARYSFGNKGATLKISRWSV